MPGPKRKPIEFVIDEKTGCFNFTNPKQRVLSVKCRPITIHRLIYEECFGEVPEGKSVTRKCGNNNCINPEHLTLTTKAEIISQIGKKYNSHPIDFEVDPVTGCFNCTSHAPNSDGYHSIMIDNKKYTVHRFVYEQMFGEIPEGLEVRHRCDNRSCCNPYHLELGTHGDNMRDMVERGRSAKGSKKKNARLTEENVREIKKRLASGEFYRDLAKEYGVNPATIFGIKKGRTWRHID